jgi:hypothetical protein
MMRALLLLLLLLPAAAAESTGAKLSLLKPPQPIPLPSNVRVFFRPQQDLEAATVTAIDQASTEILVNQLALSSAKIGEALVRAYAGPRKVTVAVILDDNPPIRNYRGFEFLELNHVPYLHAGTKGRNNQHYAVIDRRIVLLGYDWMASAPNDNQTLIVIDEPGTAAAFIQNWFEEAQRGRIPNIEKFANPDHP